MSTPNGSSYTPLRERIRKVNYDYVYGSPDKGPDDYRERRAAKLREAVREAVGRNFMSLDELETEELPKVYRAVCRVAGFHCTLDKPKSRIAEMGGTSLTDFEAEECMGSAIILRALAEINDLVALRLVEPQSMARYVERAEMLREHAAFIDWHQQTGTPLP